MKTNGHAAEHLVGSNSPAMAALSVTEMAAERVVDPPTGVINTPHDNDIDMEAGVQHVTSEADCSDGHYQRTLLPLVRMGGRLYVAENCLHFFPQ